MRIGFDCDGVFIDYTKHFAKLVNEFSNKEIDEATALYEGNSETYDAVQKALKVIYKRDEAADQWWTAIPKCCTPRDIGALHTLMKYHDVYFITARPTYLHQVTHFWIEDILGVSTPRLVTGARHKGLICKGLNIAYYMDDRYLHSLEVLDNGLTVPYLLTRSWNAAYSHPLIMRVNSIEEFVEKVKQ